MSSTNISTEELMPLPGDFYWPDFVSAFDLDLTLVDSEPLVEAAFNEMVANEKLGSLSYDGLGDSAAPLHVRLLEYCDLDEVEAMRLAEITRDIMREVGFGPTKLMKGARESVEMAQRFGKVIIPTAKPQDLSEGTLAHHGIENVQVFGGRYDDKAEVFREMGVDLSVGDSLNDMRQSRKGGVPWRVGVATGFHSRAALISAGANLALPTLEPFPGELEEIVVASRLNHYVEVS